MHYEDRLETLLRLGKTISRESDLDKLLTSISEVATEIVGADRCSIFLYDKRAGEAWSRVAHGVQELRFPADRGLVGAAIQSREMQIAADAYNDVRFYDGVDEATGYRTESLLALPVFDKRGEVLGVVELLNKRRGFFSNLDAELMVLLGNYVGAALENALLYKKLYDTQTNLIYKLSTAAEFKDEETSAHTKRVAYYSGLVAEGLGLSKEEVDALVLVAPMHDVGKIGIPDDIIRKPGKLEPDEFAVIKKHTTIGYKILFDPDNELLQKAALVARDHHERWDGGGYPAGLAGERITLEGRVLAVVDVFDALTSRRPYKEPWEFDLAAKYLRENAGSHFDPALVELFLRDGSRVREIFETYKEEE